MEGNAKPLNRKSRSKAPRLFSSTTLIKRLTALRLYGSTAGQTLVELLLALGIFAFIMTGVFALVFGGLTTGLRTEEQDYATMYAQEGMDAARSIRDRDWGLFISANDAPNTHGVTNTGTGWSWSGTTFNEITYGARKFTREIFMEDVYRTAAGDIFTGQTSANFDYTDNADHDCEGTGSCPSTNIDNIGGTAQLRKVILGITPQELNSESSNVKALYRFNKNEGVELSVSDSDSYSNNYGASLKGLWHLNEPLNASADGQTITDSQTNVAASNGIGNDGVTDNTLTYQAGKFSNALSFDGADDLVQINDSAPPLDVDYNTSTDYTYDPAKIEFSIPAATARLKNQATLAEISAPQANLQGLYHFNEPEGDELDIGVSGNPSDDDLGGASETNLKGLWHLNETSGTNAPDTSGNNNNGSLIREGTNWIKYGSNPVLNLGSASSWDVSGVNVGTVIKDGSVYKMWYSGSNSALWRIGYATSADGISWTRYDNPSAAACGFNEANDNGCILDKGATSSWDVTQAITPIVIKESPSLYKMWYAGYNGTYRIGYATSTDGISWTRYDNTGAAACGFAEANDNGCVMSVGAASSWDVTGVYVGGVIKDGSVYKMWYGGLNGTWKIGYATSNDGFTWTRYDNTGAAACGFAEANDNGCIMSVGTSNTIDDAGLLSTWVLKEGGSYKMWYGAYDNPNYRILFATSTDGISWTKPTSLTCDAYASTNCVLNRIVSTWESNYVVYPTIIEDNGTYKMWYSGHNGTNYRIGYAEAMLPIWTTAGKFSNALSFDGVDDYVDVGNAINPSGATGYTIEAWIKSTAGAVNDAIAGWYDGTNGIFIQSKGAGQGLLVLAGDGNSYGQVDVDTYTNWTHAALVYDGTLSGNINKLKLYVNGVQQTLVFGAGTVPAIMPALTSSNFKIGDVGALNRKWAGSIDEVAVYDTALGANTILEHYRRGVAEDYNPAPDLNNFDPNDGNSNGPITAVGKTGLNDALSFDGVDDYVSITDSASLSPTAMMTVEGWIKPAALAAGKALITKWASSQTTFYLQLDPSASDELRIVVADQSADTLTTHYGYTTNADLTTTGNPWYHVAVVFDGDQINDADELKLYVDGAQKILMFSGSGIPDALFDSTASVQIGGNTSQAGSYFSGLIDEVAIWNTTLTAATIAQHAGIDYLPASGATVIGPNKSVPGVTGYASFNETAIKPTNTLMDYQFSNDDGASWMYWDGNAWAIWDGASTAQYNEASVLNSAVMQEFPIGSDSAIKVKARLNTTDSSVRPELDNINIGYLSSSAPLRLGTEQTIEAWVNVTGASADWDRLIGKGVSGKENYGLWRQSDGDLKFQISNEGTTCSIWDEFGGTANIVADSEWHHIAGTRENNTMKLYLDGAEKASGICSVFPSITNDPLIMGYDSGITGVDYFNGKIDEAVIYNTALKPETIKEHYRRGVAEDATVIETAGNTFGPNDGNIYSATTIASNTGLAEALQFDGVDDYVNAGNVGTGIKSVEFWINHTTPTSGDQVLELNGTATITIEATTGNIKYGVGFTTPTIYVDGSSASAALVTGWHHVAIVDGSAGGISASAVNLGKVGAGYLAGKLDEVAIWDKTLSQQEIWAHMAQVGYQANSYATVKRSANFPTTDYIDRFKEFVETATIPAGTSIDYQLSTDNCTTMKYWDGDSWENASGWNNIRTINRYFDQLIPSSSICLSARLNTTDTNQTPVLDKVEIKYSQYRDVAATLDPHTKRVTSRVKWPSGFSFQDISLTEYLTDWNYNSWTETTYNDFFTSETKPPSLTIKDAANPDDADAGLITPIHQLFQTADTDFNGGIFNDTIVSGSGAGAKVVLSPGSAPYSASGTYESATIDLGSAAFGLDTLSWDAIVPGQANGAGMVIPATTPGLVGLWHMDSGFSATDDVVDSSASGYNLNGTASDGAALSPFTKKIGAGSGDFTADGASPSHVDVVDNNNNLDITNNISVEAWIKVSGFPAVINDIVRKGMAMDCSNDQYILRLDGNQAKFQFCDSTSVWRSSPLSNSAIVVGQWYHLVGLYESGSCVRIFVNGVEQGTPTVCGNYTIKTGSDPLTFGSHNMSDNDFDGYIDEVAIYERALTSEEIRMHYASFKLQMAACVDASGANKEICNDGAGGWQYRGPDNTENTFFIQPVGLWHFNETSGQLSDVSGSGKNGTYNGALYNQTSVAGGNLNGALGFDGIDDAATIGNIGTEIKSVEFWINNIDNDTSDEILELIDNASYVSISSGNITATGFTSPTIYIDGGNKTASPPATLGSGWHHVAIVTDAPISAASVKIGEVNNNYFSGNLDEVAIYDRALTQAEILARYNSGAGYEGAVRTLTSAGLDGKRYLRYKAYFGTVNTAYTPELDDVLITNYSTSPPPYTFVSQVYDANGFAKLYSGNWNGIEPIGSALSLEARAGNAAPPDVSWTSWTLIGSGASGSFTNLSSLDNKKYFQYQVNFTPGIPGNTSTYPILYDVTASFNGSH